MPYMETKVLSRWLLFVLILIFFILILFFANEKFEIVDFRKSFVSKISSEFSVAMDKKDINHCFPSSKYPRFIFKLANGNEILIIFEKEVDEDTKKKISEMPDTLDSLGQVMWMRKGLKIYINEKIGQIDGYEWKGYKRGAFRQLVPPGKDVRKLD